jgi:naphthalene 1,2-dioxygenase system ferredoxin subunit
MLNWIEVAAETDLFEGAGIAVSVAGNEIALFSVQGQTFALSNICSHGSGRLCEGYFEGWEVECPLHQGRFDVRTGQATCLPAIESVKTWPVKLESGRIWLQLEPS